VLLNPHRFGADRGPEERLKFLLGGAGCFWALFASVRAEGYRSGCFRTLFAPYVGVQSIGGGKAADIPGPKKCGDENPIRRKRGGFLKPSFRRKGCVGKAPETPI
jgi:hypothetical protein